MTKEELEKEKCELLGVIQGKDEAIKDLEWQLQEVAKDNDVYQAENKRLAVIAFAILMIPTKTAT